MNINKDNYEAYYLDYYEGNLTPSEVDEMLLFIEQNPEIRNEFEGYESVSLVPDETIRYEGKESLKKNGIPAAGLITAENCEEFLVAELEGYISDDELIQLNEFIAANPKFNKDRRIYSYTYLEPDLSVTFSLKESLIHKAIPVGSINESNYENIMILEVEGTISLELRMELDEFLNLNPQLGKERKLFGLTRLQPDTSIVFLEKASLKHAIVPIRKIVYYALSASASIILLMGIYFTWENKFRPTGLADNSNRIKTNTTFVSPITKNAIKGSNKQVSSPALVSNEITNPSSGQHKTTLVLKKDHNEKSAFQLPIRCTVQMPVMEAIACNKITSRDYVEPEFIFIRTSQMHSNDFLELYYNIKLAEQIQYAQLKESDKNPEKTLFNSLTSKVTGLFASNRKTQPETKSNISIWTFAQLGVKTYNSITQDDVKLELQKDENGKVISYNFVGDNINMHRDIKK